MVVTALNVSLNDNNLMKHFSQKIYFPLLDYLPKDWIEDFENILLRFEPSEHMIIAAVKIGRAHV